MLFPTAEYAIFFLLVFVGAWALRGHALAHKSLLLVASYAFYAWWDWRFLPLLVGISLFAAFVGTGLQTTLTPSRRKALLASGIAACLATLGFFKYFGFAAASVVELLDAVGLKPGPVKLPEIVLPVGVSFFVFHAISLMVDAYRAKIPVRVNVLDSLLYVAFFPQLVAGPILRASSFLPQLAARGPAGVDAARAIDLILGGLLKKVVIANFLATRLVDPTFENPSLHGGFEALLAVYGYAAQIYCDFSGYTDMAIGSALLLGYRFPDNFHAPYVATSPQDFWHRWHISLSTWLRDYLFISLGGSRGSSARTYANLVVTMVLGGLWHGAAWSFVAWGAFHGVGLALHRAWSRAAWAPIQALRAWAAWPFLARLLTFHFVCAGWVLFRATSLDAALEVFAAVGGGRWSLGPWFSGALLLAIAAGVLGQALPETARLAARANFSRWPLALQGAAFAAAALLVEAMGPQGVAPFIYFQF